MFALDEWRNARNARVFPKGQGKLCISVSVLLYDGYLVKNKAFLFHSLS